MNQLENIQKAKKSLENGELMQTVRFMRASDFFEDEDIAYFTMAIVKAVDDGDKHFEIAHQYLRDCISYLKK